MDHPKAADSGAPKADGAAAAAVAPSSSIEPEKQGAEDVGEVPDPDEDDLDDLDGE
jgi:hypothetical protein